MNEQWKRLIEAERRIARIEAGLGRTRANVAGIQGQLQNSAQNVLKPSSGGTTTSGFRWETRYRVRCIFNTAPTFSSAGSANATLDSASFTAAVNFLSDWHEFESWEYPASPASPYRYAYFYHMVGRTFYHNVGDTIDEPDWQRWEWFSASSFKKSDVTHLREHGANVRFGYFPDSYKIVIGPDELKYTGSNKYMPDVLHDYKNITEYWTTTADDNWYDRYPNLYLGEWELTNQSVLSKWVYYQKYDSGGTYSGYNTLRFAREVIDDMTEQPFDPFVFSYGPEAGTTGSYTFPARLTTSGPISSEGDVEIEIEWGPA